MIIHHCSDLHLDNAMAGGPHGWLGRIDITKWGAGGNLLIVAGDTAEHVDDAVDFLNAARSHYDRVVAVLGNHENGMASKALVPGAQVLDWEPEHRINIGPVALVGAMLDPGDREQADRIAASISAAARTSGIDQIVAVTHYPPSWRLAKLLGRRIEEACAPLLEEVVIAREKPVTWVCGHLHLPFDVDLDGIRIVANPRGYRGLRRDGTVWTGLQALDLGL